MSSERRINRTNRFHFWTNESPSCVKSASFCVTWVDPYPSSWSQRGWFFTLELWRVLSGFLRRVPTATRWAGHGSWLGKNGDPNVPSLSRWGLLRRNQGWPLYRSFLLFQLLLIILIVSVPMETRPDTCRRDMGSVLSPKPQRPPSFIPGLSGSRNLALDDVRWLSRSSDITPSFHPLLSAFSPAQAALPHPPYSRLEGRGEFARGKHRCRRTRPRGDPTVNQGGRWWQWKGFKRRTCEQCFDWFLSLGPCEEGGKWGGEDRWPWNGSNGPYPPNSKHLVLNRATRPWLFTTFIGHLACIPFHFLVSSCLSYRIFLFLSISHHPFLNVEYKEEQHRVTLLPAVGKRKLVETGGVSRKSWLFSEQSLPETFAGTYCAIPDREISLPNRAWQPKLGHAQNNWPVNMSKSSAKWNTILIMIISYWYKWIHDTGTKNILTPEGFTLDIFT